MCVYLDPIPVEPVAGRQVLHHVVISDAAEGGAASLAPVFAEALALLLLDLDLDLPTAAAAAAAQTDTS